MTKTELEQLRHLPAEIKAIQHDIDNLPMTVDSVTGSRLVIPYDKHSIQIEGLDVKRELRLKARLQIRLDELQDQLEAMEDWLDTVGDSEMRVILRLKYRNGLTDGQIGAELGYCRSAIAMKIQRFLKNEL